MDCLQADSIVKHYGTFRVLSDIHISCTPGEVVGLIGRNGCGKSTLLKIIFGSLPSDQKFVRANGQQIFTLTDSLKQIKYLPQDNYLPKNTSLGKLLDLFDDSFEKEKFKTNPLVSKLIHQKPAKLSGGERRLAEILLILYSNANYFLLDEPFNGVAPVHKGKIKALIKEKSADKGIIITDHDYRNVLDISDRIYMIYHGGIKIIKDPEELKFWGYIPQA